MFNMYGPRIRPIPSNTALADTAFLQHLEPLSVYRQIVTRLTILCAATAQTLTVMQALARTTTSASALASQKVINLTADPGIGTVAGGIASGDYCIVELTDGTHQVNLVDSVSTLAITFIDDFSQAVKSGAKVYFYGTAANGHEQVAVASGGETTFESSEGWFVAKNAGYPLLFHLNNITNACILQGGVVIHTTS